MMAITSRMGLIRVTGRKLVLVEGKDEANFFNALLKQMELLGDIQVLDIGGKTQLANKFPAIVNMQGFSTLASYAIILDADEDSQGTFGSVRAVLQRSGQPCPSKAGTYADGSPKVGVYIVPGGHDKGMLEDMCLATVCHHPIMPCMESYIECLRASLSERQEAASREPGCHFFPKNLAKAKARAFLAGMYEDIPSVGVAALAGCWDLTHEALKDMKSFLTQL